jgi:RNA polymerase sigma-70 factor (ECF subfamily)
LIHKVCWAYTRTPEDRDDLFQEIAVRLLSAARNYDPTRKLSTWVYRVALNVAIDFHRQRLRRRKVLLGFEGDGQPTTEVDRALLLLHLDGNSYREIGEVIGISETNVGTRLSRLKKTLRESAATIG